MITELGTVSEATRDTIFPGVLDEKQHTLAG
jgi:hypothetical protein